MGRPTRFEVRPKKDENLRTITKCNLIIEIDPKLLFQRRFDFTTDILPRTKRLMVRLVRRQCKRRVGFDDDEMSIGYHCLYRTYKTYNPTRPVKFVTLFGVILRRELANFFYCKGGNGHNHNGTSYEGMGDDSFDETIAKLEWKNVLNESMQLLDPATRRLLYRYYFEKDTTLESLGRERKITREAIRLRLEKAIRIIRQHIRTKYPSIDYNFL